jgi:hypothetical protein
VDGGHQLEAEPAGEGAVRLRHVAEAELRGRRLVAWALVIRPLHDALLEDLLDRAELAVTGTVARPNRWSPWVRLVRRRRLRGRDTRTAATAGRR